MNSIFYDQQQRNILFSICCSEYSDISLVQSAFLPSSFQEESVEYQSLLFHPVLTEGPAAETQEANCLKQYAPLPCHNFINVPY